MRLESEEFGNIGINFSPCITVWVFGRVGFSLAWTRLVTYGAEAWKKSPWLQYLRAGVRIRGARRSCRAFTRSASSEEACRSAANAHARHAATGGVSHRALKGEPRALASALRLPVRRAGVFFSLCVEGRRSKPSATALLSRAIAERLGKRLSRDLPHRPCCCVAVALSASPALSYG